MVMEWTLMFLGYIFLGSLLLFVFVLLPLWYIGKTNAEQRNKCNKKYDNLECLYYFDVGTEEEALINWADPGDIYPF